MKPLFAEGDIVRSKACGARAAFEGHIAEAVQIRTDKGTVTGFYYHVRDAAGRLWHRSANELQAGQS